MWFVGFLVLAILSVFRWDIESFVNLCFDVVSFFYGTHQLTLRDGLCNIRETNISALQNYSPFTLVYQSANDIKNFIVLSESP